MVEILPWHSDVVLRPVKFVKGSAVAGLSISFSARATGFYADATTTVATLSVQGLPLLSPSEFEVNAVEGTHPPYTAYYGGTTSLTSGTLTAIWRLSQQALGFVGGEVSYANSNSFSGANQIQIKVVMQLRRGLLPEGSLYEWGAFAIVAPGGSPMSKSGTARIGASLTFVLNVTPDDPLSATFTAEPT